jgi:Concanavalin A-like lectin/glucanases superfamily
MSSDIQPIFVSPESRHFDGRSQHVVVPHRPEWLLEQGVVVLDFTADRLKGDQGLISKDANGKLDGGHLTIRLDEGKVVVRLQDKKSDYVVQSPPNTVKRGVPTRLALAFGPGGMKLYVDGKAVGSNAYQGGLQGNQEPLVIGALDWKSSPGTADNLEAFFAGAISWLALYARSLDAPAIAALGPAGTVPAQVDLLGPSVQQTVQMVVTEGPTITFSPEELEKNLNISPTLGITPTPEAPVTVASAPNTFNPIVMSIEQSIRQHTGSTDENQLRAALYVSFMEILKNPSSPQRQAVMDWLALQVKQTRVEAARLALAEYDRWDRDPWNYQPPAGYDFPTYAIPPPGHFLWLSSTPNPPVLANKSWGTYFADIISNNGWSPLNNPMLNKGQKSSSIENVVGFPTFGTVRAYEKLYGTEGGPKILAETTAYLSSGHLKLPLVKTEKPAELLAKITANLSSDSLMTPQVETTITSPTGVATWRVVHLETIAPFTQRNLNALVAELANRIRGVSKRVSFAVDEKTALADIVKTFTKKELRSAIGKIASGEILSNFVVSFVLSSALQEIISESFMLDTKVKLRGELVAELRKQQAAPPDVSNLLYYDLNDIIQIYADDYQPTDPVELERMMGPQEVYRAFLLSTIK